MSELLEKVPSFELLYTQKVSILGRRVAQKLLPYSPTPLLHYSLAPLLPYSLKKTFFANLHYGVADRWV